MSLSTMTLAPPIAPPPAVPADFKRAWLLAPGVIWMLLFLLLPMSMMVYVSFWTQTTFTIEPVLTLDSWRAFFATPTYVGALWTTISLWSIVLLGCLLLGYPVALYIGFFVTDKRVQTPPRGLPGGPMLASEGAINLILMQLGIIGEPLQILLFSPLSVVIGMVQIYVV